MSIKEYRLTSMEEPTDAMLHELMYQVACSARQSSYNAKQVLKQKMQETIELIQKLSAVHSLASSFSVVDVLPEPFGPATTHKTGRNSFTMIIDY